MKWEYDGKFLDAFDKRWRGTIGDQICRIIRNEMNDADEVLQILREKCDANVEADYNAEFYEQLALETYSPLAKEFVAFLIERENLPFDEKQKLKTEWQQREKQSRMNHTPPTDKQIAYLRSLGVQEIPATMTEASYLIGKAKQ